jgi:hypothetical protein
LSTPLPIKLKLANILARIMQGGLSKGKNLSASRLL